jgi:hypothetical protein
MSGFIVIKGRLFKKANTPKIISCKVMHPFQHGFLAFVCFLFEIHFLRNYSYSLQLARHFWGKNRGIVTVMLALPFANIYLELLVYCLHTWQQQPFGRDLLVDHTNLYLHS